ncbi:MAG TPA: methyltransferase domain-containing protein [Humisphaera sp.]|jgi:hypothetical protein|nr:methyltransferase domain-containing protein [Humisphaera sp.]
MTTTLTPPTSETTTLSWQQYLQWARRENEHMRAISGVHGNDHPNPDLRGRTYFEVNCYRYFHALQVCWPYINRPNQKIMDVGSWPGAWLRAIAHFAAAHKPEIWASGLIFPPDFIEKMGGACKGTLKCELDVWSPMHEREAPNVFTERNFTFVSAMEVVEHLYHPGWMFRIIHDAMVPGGVLFMTTNNVGRLSNIVGMLKGGGMAGNLDELLPRDGGKLGHWRPHAREYCWQELNHVALQYGFHHISHGFYSENYGLRLLEEKDQPSEELPYNDEGERRFVEAVRPMLMEQEQLKSGMYLVFRRM